MIEDFKSRLMIVQEKMHQLVSNKLAIERDINRGEPIEEYLLEKVQILSECQSDMFWIAMEMQMLITDMNLFNDKFYEAKYDPQVKELWETIETAMAMVK